MICTYRHCDKEMELCKHNPNRKYCSPECNANETSLLRKEKRAAKYVNLPIVICAYRKCSEEVSFNKFNPNTKKYCSPYCKAKELSFTRNYDIPYTASKSETFLADSSPEGVQELETLMRELNAA